MTVEEWLKTPEGIEYQKPYTACTCCLRPMNDVILCEDCVDFICARVSGCPGLLLCGDLECLRCNEELTD